MEYQKHYFQQFGIAVEGVTVYSEQVITIGQSKFLQIWKDHMIEWPYIKELVQIFSVLFSQVW